MKNAPVGEKWEGVLSEDERELLVVKVSRKGEPLATFDPPVSVEEAERVVVPLR